MEDTTIEDVLKTFEASYAQKDFAKALELLKSHKASFSSDVWEYDMGTVLANLGQLPEARAHFLRAQTLGFSGSELVQNLSLTEEKLDLPRAEKAIEVTDYLYRGTLELSTGYDLTLFLLVLVTGLIALKKNFSWMRVSAIVMALVTILGGRFWMATKAQYVVLDPVVVQEGPSVIFSKVAEIPPGVRILGKEEGSWIRIDYPARYAGWIGTKNLFKLEQ